MNTWIRILLAVLVVVGYTFLGHVLEPTFTTRVALEQVQDTATSSMSLSVWKTCWQIGWVVVTGVVVGLIYADFLSRRPRQQD